MASRSAGFRLARCDMLFTMFGQSWMLQRQSAGSVWHSMCRVSLPTPLPLQFPHDSETRKPGSKILARGQPLTDTDYHYVRAAFLRYGRGRGRRARIRRISRKPARRQTCLQIAPNRAPLALQSGLYDVDSGDADDDDKGKHDRVFYRRWIVEEGHRDPGLGLSVRRRLLKRHTGEKILLDDDRGGKKTAQKRLCIITLPGVGEDAGGGACLQAACGVA